MKSYISGHAPCIIYIHLSKPDTERGTSQSPAEHENVIANLNWYLLVLSRRQWHTQIYQMYLIASQTYITSHFFLSCSQENTALNRGLVYDHFSWVPAVCDFCFSWRVPNRGLFILNSGRSPGAVQCLPWMVLDGHSTFTPPQERARGAAPCVLSHCSAMDPTSLLTEDHPLFFETWQWAWELPGWAEAVAPTKHSAATCRLSSVPCLILSRLLKTSWLL